MIESLVPLLQDFNSMLKKWIKKIPVIGNLAVGIKRKIKPFPYETSEKYWVDRYKNGGNSGRGSYNAFAEHKAEVINNFIKKHNIQSVIEFGSGDGNQLEYFNFKNYIGYEISPAAIEICKEKFSHDDSKKFYHNDEYKKTSSELTMSLDVIYCLTEDEAYNEYMNRLFECSNKYVLIFSSNHSNNKLSRPHMKHRVFTDWIKQNKPEFEQIDFVKNRLAKAEQYVSDFYFFELKSTK